MKKFVSLLMGIVMCLTLTACEVIVSDKAYPVKFDDTEITVGTTTVGTLLDAGFEVKESSSDEEGYSGDLGVAKNSYFSGLIVTKGDLIYAVIDIVTGSKDTTLSEAVVAKIMASTGMDDALDHISFDGVALLDVSTDVFKEHVKGGKVEEDGSKAYCIGHQYSIQIYYENGEVTELNIGRRYDVEYGSN